MKEASPERPGSVGFHVSGTFGAGKAPETGLLRECWPTAGRVGAGDCWLLQSFYRADEKVLKFIVIWQLLESVHILKAIQFGGGGRKFWH